MRASGADARKRIRAPSFRHEAASKMCSILHVLPAVFFMYESEVIEMTRVYCMMENGKPKYQYMNENGTVSEYVEVSDEVEEIIFAAYKQGREDRLPKEDSAENDVNDVDSQNQVLSMSKACDYDFPIAALSDEVNRMKAERSRLLKREARTELRKLKANNDFLRGECHALRMEVNDIRRWMSRPRTLGNGTVLNCWEMFVRDFPEYDWPPYPEQMF